MCQHHHSHAADDISASRVIVEHDHDGDCHVGHCNHSHDDGHAFHSQVELWFAVIAVVALPTAWLLDSNVLYGITFVSGGFFAAVDAVRSLLRGRLTIDTLMIAAGFGAASIGHLPEGALLLTLFSLGHAAEHYAMQRAERSIHALAQLRPLTALRIDPITMQSVEVSIDEIEVGETVLVRPDSRIAVDGVAVQGQSSVDQSPITGESIPVDKFALEGFDAKTQDAALVPKEHQVFAGSINGFGALHVQVTRRCDDSTLARFVRLIAQAKTQRSPTQRLASTFERKYVPAVLALVAVLLLAFLVVEETFTQSLYRSMAVLVAASPCALAIATPSAVLSAIARAGRDGVLIKGGGPLEQLGRVTAVAFDKTGTLTTGRPEVVDVVNMLDVSREEVISAAASVQRLSDHPLARAIVRADDESGHQDFRNHKTSKHVAKVERIAGQGVVAHIDGELVAVGNAKLFQGSATGGGSMPTEIASAESALRANGRTIAIVRRGEAFLGVIGIVDTPRPVAKQVIVDLRRIGLRPLVMLSGDHQQAAQSIARELGLDDARGDLLPEDKVAEVSKLSQTYVTAMVGDGANDAPAMAVASVSIAMGAAGSDVALETADIALMGDDIAKLPFAIALAQASNRITRQNLWISLGTIAFLLPATILGFRLGAAVVLHEGSTLVVVANALRLLRFRSPKSTLPVA